MSTNRTAALQRFLHPRQKLTLRRKNNIQKIFTLGRFSNFCLAITIFRGEFPKPYVLQEKRLGFLEPLLALV
jgi:hypothetical protein